MKLNQYLYTQLGLTFFPIFLGLYFITSIIFLVKIASWTSIIQINFAELALLYLYVVPNILFYTLPIAFFISLVITLSKLSSEYELIVITSFGLNPVRVLKVFLPITFIISVSLLIISLGLIPKTKHLTNSFYAQKKKEANFNIKASEFGQKFGDWLIYITSKEKKKFHEVKLFKTENNSDQFIISKTANLNNDSGNLSFQLNDGKTFHINENIVNQINFESMHINDTLSNSKTEEFDTPISFWKNKLKKNDDIDKMTFYVLTSIFPFISLFLVIAFGYFNPRYEKNHSVSYAVLFVVLYYVLVDFLAKKFFLNALYVIPVIWVCATYFIYTRRVKKVY